MKRLRRILVAIADPQHVNGSVLRRAAELARATGAKIELFHAVTAPLMQSRRVETGQVDVQLSIDHSVSAAQKKLDRVAHSKLLQGCRVDSLAVWDRPSYEAIVRRALDTGPDLIINGTHTRGFANRMVLRHTDWELVRHAPVPLLLVKSHRRTAKPVVLAAIDPLHANAKPTRLDDQILDLAAGMTTALKGTLHAFHAYIPLSVTLATGVGEPLAWNTTQLDADYSRRVVREFTRALRATPIPLNRRHLRLGDPAAELVRCTARIRATLVVMGAVSRSHLEKLFVGSTAERVLDELTCDVLIVKSPGFKRLGAVRKGK